VLPKLAIIAGTGTLPSKVYSECIRQGRECVIVTFYGENQNTLIHSENFFVLPLGSIGKTINFLKSQSCEDVILIGSFKRPNLTDIKDLDWKGAKLISKVIRSNGDNSALSLILNELEHEGFNVLRVSDILPDLIMNTISLTDHQPNSEQINDIKLGVDLLNTISPYDIGQSAVVSSKRVLGIEGPEGTDALIERCSSFFDSADKPILIKSSKINQDLRVDLPTIGLNTIELVISKGYAGMALELNKSILLDKENVIKQANNSGLFIYGMSNNRN
tara:strand:- start:176 stop:1000 length:825 start_codon:yes stop_codon:yes gene_type:complete